MYGWFVELNNMSFRALHVLLDVVRAAGGRGLGMWKPTSGGAARRVVCVRAAVVPQ